MKIINKGKKFNGWMVMEGPFLKKEICNNKVYNRHYYRVKCICGKQNTLISYSFQYGNSKSCGCLQKKDVSKRFRTHGMRKTRFYKIYSGINYRSKNRKFKHYINIKCLWNSFEEFKKDMYPSYQRHVKKFGEKNTTIDRVNSKGNYEKSNCRWATYREQANNTCKNYLITFDKKTRTLAEWSKILKIKRLTLRYRLKNNWPINIAFKTKVSSSNRLKNIKRYDHISN